MLGLERGGRDRVSAKAPPPPFRASIITVCASASHALDAQALDALESNRHYLHLNVPATQALRSHLSRELSGPSPQA